MVSIVANLPDPVRSLMERKLGLLKRELEQEYIGSKQRAFSKLRDGMRANMSTSAIGKVLISVPIEVYREMAANVLSMTKHWPMAVWDAIAHVLDKAELRMADASALSAIVDKFAWSHDQAPFTLDYIQPERFRDSVFRSASRYGIGDDDMKSSFERQLDLVAASFSAGILNQGRQAREAVAIAIDEYVCSAELECSATGSGKKEALSSSPDAIPPQEPASPCAVFKAMKKLTADEIIIAFVGDMTEEGLGANNMLEITARAVTRRVPLATLGLVNRRNGAPNSQCAVLLGMARNLPMPGGNASSQKIRRLRVMFSENLGIEDDLFEVYRKAVGWVPRFKLSDNRGAADARAQKNAEIRRVSLEHWHESLAVPDDLQDEEDTDEPDGDDADIWLKANDPNQPE
jgi:hypothetical protein